MDSVLLIIDAFAEGWKWIQPYDLLIALVFALWMVFSLNSATRRLLCRVLNFDMIFLLAVPALLCAAYCLFR